MHESDLVYHSKLTNLVLIYLQEHVITTLKYVQKLEILILLSEPLWIASVIYVEPDYLVSASFTSVAKRSASRKVVSILSSDVFVMGN